MEDWDNFLPWSWGHECRVISVYLTIHKIKDHTLSEQLDVSLGLIGHLLGRLRKKAYG